MGGPPTAVTCDAIIAAAGASANAASAT